MKLTETKLAGVVILEPDVFGAVSYTHLDVYKRQSIQRIVIPIQFIEYMVIISYVIDFPCFDVVDLQLVTGRSI